MGSSVKTLIRLMRLTEIGALAPESAVCDIGATQLLGDGAEEGARSFLGYYAARTSKATRPADVSDEQIRDIAHGGFLGDLLVLSGFRYVALDIFQAKNTILFDLNIHAPGPRLASQFDLVTNFGTTEHVLNQLRAFQTIHELVRPGGLMYHDLPFAGYFDHAYFRYDPLFFRAMVEANGYEVLLKEISMDPPHPVPADVAAMGYRDMSVADVGIEMVVRRTDSSPFRTYMETSTSLSDSAVHEVGASDAVVLPAGTTVSYGTPLDEIPFEKIPFEMIPFDKLPLHQIRHGLLLRAWSRSAAAGVRRRFGQVWRS